MKWPVKRNRNENSENIWNINILRSSLKSPTPAQRQSEVILALHSEGFGHKRIAKKLGLSRQSVYRILKRAGHFDKPTHLD